MKQEDENNLILKIIKYGKDKDGFRLGDMFENLKLSSEDKTFVEYKLCDFGWGNGNPNHIIGFNSNSDLTKTFGLEREKFIASNEARILPNALFSYIDHLEIIEARLSAKAAKRLSWIAIWISTGIGLASLIVGLIQTLKDC